jgi:hypothetical protein
VGRVRTAHSYSSKRSAQRSVLSIRGLQGVLNNVAGDRRADCQRRSLGGEQSQPAHDRATRGRHRRLRLSQEKAVANEFRPGGGEAGCKSFPRVARIRGSPGRAPTKRAALNNVGNLINSQQYVGDSLKYPFRMRENALKLHRTISVTPMIDWADLAYLSCQPKRLHLQESPCLLYVFSFPAVLSTGASPSLAVTTS